MLNIIPHLLIGPIETFLRQILSVLMMLLMLVLVIEIQVVKSALAETPLGPMASSIPTFGAEAAAGPAHMNPVSISPLNLQLCI